MSQELSFNELPGAVAALIEKVDELKALIVNRNDEDNAKEEDQLFVCLPSTTSVLRKSEIM